MHVYNAVLVLKEILPVFPMKSVSDFTGLSIYKTGEKLVEKEKRNDLKILADA